ncbi:RepA leader peptide Tap [Salmonella enterica]|uniref:RepA leader peptide Tap n=2 Tax=Salmonella enterica TaxID=28901 RepID=A0A5V6NHY8_SALET|nr:RepA leader peptide Tap [Salmonella enterica]EAA7484613.1 RepA leader peptide Tap [Salmonella enterica subsp. enterica serovar Irumu]EAA8418631.1 RepA leader peptide Tap [Salmonella enterica subsp. enterica]EAM4448716.1 RepA leader peptide Tap [Salmonella enterica subsp. enterica serovar Infantis]EAP4147082.1 RepA leader peptide Tap [Salmonella enterica subsp. enterica serovar Anatum]EBL6567152.1 RepA leader peptide Tap [Salmonella enterica subsp. enterica serovar Muenchen]EBS4388582.1 Rep
MLRKVQDLILCLLLLCNISAGRSG